MRKQNQSNNTLRARLLSLKNGLNNIKLNDNNNLKFPLEIESILFSYRPNYIITLPSTFSSFSEDRLQKYRKVIHRVTTSENEWLFWLISFFEFAFNAKTFVIPILVFFLFSFS